MKIHVESDFEIHNYEFNVTPITKNIISFECGPDDQFKFNVNEIDDGRYYSIELWAGSPPVELNVFSVVDDWETAIKEIADIIMFLISDELLKTARFILSQDELQMIKKELNRIEIHQFDNIL